ncbi:MAG: hypothetical protein ACRC46_02790 [Thermoguttaceae bacterium]
MPKYSITSLLLAFAVFCGCTSVPVNPFAFSKKVKSPARMVDVWNTYAQTDPEGGPPLRGLAGRIVFYPEMPAKSKKPPQAIQVSGTVTVFIFDGLEEDPQHAKPLKQFIFKPETLPFHYAHKEPIGHGYDFFLPIDEHGGPEKTLSVIVRFDDRTQEGKLVVTQPVATILEGSTTGRIQPQPTAYRDILPPNFAQASHRETNSSITPAQTNNNVHSSRVVGTIPLSMRDTQRLGNGEFLAQGEYSVTPSAPSAEKTVRDNNATSLVYEQFASMRQEATATMNANASAYSPLYTSDLPMPQYPDAWAPAATIPFANQYAASAASGPSGSAGVGSSVVASIPLPPVQVASPQTPASFAPSNGQAPPDLHYREYR